jgi:peptidoglycan/LPS O-acetylase OafA/YrhL
VACSIKKRDPRADRFGNIDSLRGVARLLVVYIHSVQWLQDSGTKLPALEAWLLDTSVTVVDPGKVGVLVFFAISGFVVPMSLMRARPHATRAFVVNRSFRILPAYWLSLAIGAPLMVAALGHEVTMASLVGNAIMAPQLFKGGFVLKVYWSLQVELVFYVLCLALFLTGLIRHPLLPGRAAIGFLLLGLLAAILRHRLTVPAPVGLLLFLSLMFWGFCARLQVENDSPALRRQLAILVVLYLGLMPVICYLAYGGMPTSYGTWQAYAASYVLAVLIFLTFGILLQADWAPLTWVGRVSYSVYLFHVICIVAIGSLVAPLLPENGLGTPVILGFAAISLVAAAATYRLAEEPMIRFGRTLNRTLDRRRSPWAWGARCDEVSRQARPAER